MIAHQQVAFYSLYCSLLVLSYTLITIGFHLLCELQTEPGAKQNVWKLISVSKKNEKNKKSNIILNTENERFVRSQCRT